MRSRNNGGVIGAYAAPTVNHANGVFFIHDAAIYNTGLNPIWPLASGFVYEATGGVIGFAVDNSNWKTHTFTSNGTFTVVNGAGPLEILVVGGGGGGGRPAATGTTAQGGGGGGGGGVVVVSTWVESGTIFDVTVGPGGNTWSISAHVQTPGGNSSVISNAGHNYVGLGGGGGGMGHSSPVNLTANTGLWGSSGGNGWYSSSSLANASTSTASSQSTSQWGGYGNVGGTSYNWPLAYYGGGGGGGAGTPGHNARDSVDQAFNSRGGDGYLWTRTNCYYGAGGGGSGIFTSNIIDGRVHNVSSGTYWIMPGLTGPAPGVPSLTSTGGFGYVSESSGVAYAGQLYSDVNSTHQYGLGGGATSFYTAATSTTFHGGSGGKGVVIFCYRYK